MKRFRSTGDELPPSPPLAGAKRTSDAPPPVDADDVICVDDGDDDDGGAGAVAAAARGSSGSLRKPLAGAKHPAVVVFDLDDTLWIGDVADHVPPFRPMGDGAFSSSGGGVISLHPEAVAVVSRLVDARVPVAIASRTHSPKAAEELLKAVKLACALPTAKKTLWDAIESPGCFQAFFGGVAKEDHFKRIRAALPGSPPYREYLLFDDLASNVRKAQSMGAVAVQVKRGGVSLEALELGLAEWRRSVASKGVLASWLGGGKKK